MSVTQILPYLWIGNQDILQKEEFFKNQMISDTIIINLKEKLQPINTTFHQYNWNSEGIMNMAQCIRDVLPIIRENAIQGYGTCIISPDDQQEAAVLVGSYCIVDLGLPLKQVNNLLKSKRTSVNIIKTIYEDLLHKLYGTNL